MTSSRQSTRLIPDKDNIIPICDDDYFDDDITGRFVKWVEAVYGSDTLEENLKFIADALGGKGTPREVIRSYFLNDFYADHCKTYQKRPIYWLFDSGKKNGFKTLIYDRMFQRYGEATLTFRKVVDTVSQDHNFPSQAVEIALSQMMNEGLMVKRRHRTPRGNSINIVAPEWDKLIEAGLYKPES